MIDDVEAFHKASGQLILGDDQRPGLTRRVLRHRLLREEMNELEDALIGSDIVEVADAYADIIYIVLGSALMHIGKERFLRVWSEVHRTNMAKCPNGKSTSREDGKIVKPDGWTPPDIAGILTP